MRGGSLHLSLQLEALPNHVGQVGEDLREVAAGLALQQHCRHEKLQIEQRHALGQVAQRHLDREAEVAFVEHFAKLARQRLRRFFREHLESDRKGVSRPHRPGQELQGFRELFLEGGQPLLSLPQHVHIRHNPRDEGENRDTGSGVQQHREFRSDESSDDAKEDHRNQQRVQARRQPGLLDVRLHLLREIEAADESNQG